MEDLLSACISRSLLALKCHFKIKMFSQYALTFHDTYKYLLYEYFKNNTAPFKFVF